MTLFEQITLLATGLTALYLIIRFIQEAKLKGKLGYDLYYIISFTVLLVSGLLLIFLGWSILPSPWVILVTSLLPLGIAIGLVYEFHEKQGTSFLIFGIVALIAIAVAKFMNYDSAAKIIVPLVHSICGLTIVIVPILAVKNGKVPGGFIFVTIGGILIGLGGIALAFIRSGSQLLFFSPEFVMTILAPLMLLMTLCYTYGFVKYIISQKRK